MNPQHTLVREHIRAGGRACALEAGVNGQMITLYDRGGHIPLLWTHLIPATLEGRAHAQRAERDVRRLDRVLARPQARRDPPGPAHLRHDVLPGAGPHERLQRAPVQGAVRLRPQRARGRHARRPRDPARRLRAAHRRAGRARRPPRRGPARRSRRRSRAASTTTSAAATTTCATAGPTKCRASWRRRCSRRACRSPRSR